MHRHSEHLLSCGRPAVSLTSRLSSVVDISTSNVVVIIIILDLRGDGLAGQGLLDAHNISSLNLVMLHVVWCVGTLFSVDRVRYFSIEECVETRRDEEMMKVESLANKGRIYMDSFVFFLFFKKKKYPKGS